MDKEYKNNMTLKGKIKWFSHEKGYGFLSRENGDDIFFHHSQVMEDVTEGDKVEFSIGKGPKGPIGKEIRKEPQK